MHQKSKVGVRLFGFAYRILWAAHLAEGFVTFVVLLLALSTTVCHRYASGATLEVCLEGSELAAIHTR